jgi:hypothetical protein
LEALTFTGDDLKVIFSNATIGVTGTFYQATQPVSLADKVVYDTHLDSALAVTMSDRTVYDSHFDAAIAVTMSDRTVYDTHWDTPPTVKTSPNAKSGTVFTADGQVKGTAGTVYAVLVSGVGVTAADKVEIKNSADNSGASLVTIVADAANGTWAFYPCVGITYGTGIYSDETKSGGTFTVTVVWE